MILWWVLDISCLCEQSIRLGGLHKVTASMWLVLFMHGLYIVDALYHEVSKIENGHCAQTYPCIRRVHRRLF
jgi:hypothetical protein